MIKDLVDHDIYAGNLIMGQSLLFTLNLPPHWHLAPGVSRPEVNAIARQSEDDQIVVNGNAWYVIYEGERNWALEFAARIRPLPKNKPDPSIGPSNGQLLSISNHPAKLEWKTTRRGLPWQRHDVKYMTIKFSCPRSDRQICLEFSGWCPQEGFEEILRAVRYLKCH